MINEFKDNIILVSCLPGLGISDFALRNVNVIYYQEWVSNTVKNNNTESKDRVAARDIGSIIQQNVNTLAKGCLFIISDVLWELLTDYIIQTSVYIHMHMNFYTNSELKKRGFIMVPAISDPILQMLNKTFMLTKNVEKNRHYKIDPLELININRIFVFCDEHNMYSVEFVSILIKALEDKKNPHYSTWTFEDEFNSLDDLAIIDITNVHNNKEDKYVK